MMKQEHTKPALQVSDEARARLAQLTPEQRQRLLALARQANDTGKLHGRFEDWAKRRPDAIAVSCDGMQLSYGELDAQADGLARHIVAAGVKPGELVAITLDRGLPLVVAILGVLKAGAAYLPIDPSVPEERQRFIREDAQARLVLSVSRYQAALADCGTPVRLLDEVAEPVPDVVLPEVTGKDLAYVIYTSGSTGKPKGVMVEHGNVTRLFTSTERHFGFSEQDVWSLFHSYAFDFSVWEIWGALLYGGRLVIVPYEVSRTPAAVADLLLQEGVTVLNQTPTAFSNLMTELLARNDAGKLRYVIFGGEALEPMRLARWVARFGDATPALVNMYGITETTVHVTYKRVLAQDVEQGISDIGLALDDLKLYVLNERQKPVPQGVVGELYVGGAGVSRGYLNRPELTAERFIDNPFGETGRLYRTGDLARKREGGVLEYIGRNDGQVKLRGFRIELGDIERHLIGHEAVRDAVVTLMGQGEERSLAAYLVLGQPVSEDWKSSLYRYLAGVLPDYMIPSHVVPLAVLPQTNNGKIDRDSLPEPGSDDVWQQRYVAPVTEAEQVLCRLVGELLQLERVGTHDNFFALGGDSLKTVNLVASAKAAGRHMTVADVFDCPCIADLALRLQQDAAPGERVVGAFDLISEADRARLPDGIEAAYPMSRLQQGMVYHNLASSDNSLYHNVLNQRYRGGLDIARMRSAMRNVMAAHEILRTSFQLHGYAEPLQLVHACVEPPIHVYDLRAMSAEAQHAHLAAELDRLRLQRLDLAAPPLFQAHAYLIAEGELELIWLEHHAILDGWSLASFMTQLMTEYATLAQQGVSAQQLPPAPYRLLIEAEQAALADPAQAAFWSSYMADAPYTQLHTEHGGDQSAKQISPVEIPAAQFAHCRRLAGALGVPLKSLFLAAYAKVISLFSGELDVLVGLTTHGRPEIAGGDHLLGLYVSTHPLRLDCGPASWAELVSRCYRAEADIWAKRFYPLSEIKRLHADRELFETSFTYNHFSVTEQAEDIGIEATRSKRAFEFESTGLGVAFVVMDMKRDVGQIHVSFDAARFDAGFARRVQHYLCLALAQMVEGMDAAARLLSQDDAALMARLAAMPGPTATSDSLMSVFTALAQEHADFPAIKQGGQWLSYAELSARIAIAAQQLRQLGIQAGQLVGFDTQPSVDMVIALLATWRLGAVFVPLDPEQSQSRLYDIVTESGLRHIVADSDRWVGSLPEGVQVHLLQAMAAASNEGEAPPAMPVVLSDDLAYVIYTSGSTGRPKGVTINHGNALAFLGAIQRRYGLQSGERLLQISNTGFDVFIEELLASLFSGSTLVLRETPRLPDAAEFWALVGSERINVLSLPTAYWNLLCTELPSEAAALDCLRVCAVGGEAMPREQADRWLSRFGGQVALLNVYGPAEATVTATTFDVRILAAEPDRYSGVPIGQPLDNGPCWVLGKDMQPLPQGVVGELHIGGLSLSPGYLNQPEQTQQRFVQLLLDGMPSQRVYRTGDLVRLLADGQLEFVGRKDGQVKIRGFRVEIEEVRQVIGEVPGVVQCFVMPVQGISGAKQLAAYVVLDGAGLDGVIAQVKERLPGYMRPASWACLESLPMTANRKVDIKALPLPEFNPQDRYVAPANALEREIQSLWEGVLERTALSVDADFFALGGHSLLLTRLLLRISQSCDVALSMAELMRARTIREMAELIAATRSIRLSLEHAEPQASEEMEW
ncbi:amino acid adenylation domain-containing protein [Chitinimonas sp. JJ19]|uniref:amino acid adenylation domain-containing protein n=1 Tax=Chitinimonas sp. JJ19 TaxID=3109352 RepID=UPI0030031094